MSDPASINLQMVWEVCSVWYAIGFVSCLFWGVFLRGGWEGFVRDLKTEWSLVLAPVICGFFGPVILAEGLVVWYFIQRPIDLEKKFREEK